jgi:hypothetical protein
MVLENDIHPVSSLVVDWNILKLEKIDRALGHEVVHERRIVYTCPAS